MENEPHLVPLLFERFSTRAPLEFLQGVRRTIVTRGNVTVCAVMHTDQTRELWVICGSAPEPMGARDGRLTVHCSPYGSNQSLRCSLRDIARGPLLVRCPGQSRASMANERIRPKPRPR